ncbi:MAG: DUF3108 domain-containing protein [Bacteroidetes bacterium]|nr:DUF3108 domain-containing protein [Bacteroidota bacterium]
MNICRITTITLAILTLWFVSPSTAHSQMAFPGEELEYEVSFLGIKLGTIKMITEQSQTLNGKTVYKMKALIDSRSGIPFVDLHSIYESWMDASATYSHQFTANTKKSENTWVYDKYSFDYDNNVIRTEKYEDKKLIEKKSISTPKKWNDGCSLFFTARQLLFAKRNIKIPTVVQEDTVFTTIAFTGKDESTSIDAVDYPVKTTYFHGEANWTGIYGITGKFEGWFSTDDARVPIKAKMKLYVGSATIELVKWKRGSWQPPKAD